MNATTKPFEPLGDGAFLGSLSPSSRSALLTGGETVTYAAGEPIPRPASDEVPGVVLDGLARIFITTADQRQATLLYVRAGHCVGLAKSLAGYIPAEVEAVSPTRVHHFDSAHYAQALETDVVFAHAVAAELARYVAAQATAFEVFVSGSVRRRVAFHILSLSSPDTEGRLVARITQRGLAGAVGSVRAVVARAVRELRDEGILLILQGGVLVVDVDGLRRIAAGDR